VVKFPIVRRSQGSPCNSRPGLEFALKVSSWCAFNTTVGLQGTRPEPNGFSFRWIASDTVPKVFTDCAFLKAVGRHNQLTPRQDRQDTSVLCPLHSYSTIRATSDVAGAVLAKSTESQFNIAVYLSKILLRIQQLPFALFVRSYLIHHIPPFLMVPK